MTDKELRQRAWDAFIRNRDNNAKDGVDAAVDVVLAALPTESGLTEDEIEYACPWLPDTGHNAHREGWYDGVAWASRELAKRRTATTGFTWEQVQAAFDYASQYVLLPDLAKAKFRQEWYVGLRAYLKRLGFSGWFVIGLGIAGILTAVYLQTLRQP